MKAVVWASFFLVSTAVWGQSTPWDATGNGLLSGVYNFRQVHLETANSPGTFSRRVAVWGQITFDGRGAYTISGSFLDSATGSAKPLSQPGTYAISSSGFGFLDSPVLKNALTFGLVSQGIFIGSTTESSVYDLFIAAPVSATTTQAFSGKYWVADISFLDANAQRTRDFFFQINPNGNGALGNLSLSSFAGGTGVAASQTITGANYSFNSAGTGSITYPSNAANLISGSQVLYVTPDRKFIFGGSETNWDMFVGVVPLSAPATQDAFSGLYYVAALEQDNSNLSRNAILDSYYGSFLVIGNSVLGHQRVLSGTGTTAYNFTYADTVMIAPDGTHDDFLDAHHILGANGNIRIGYGTGNKLGLTIALRAPVLDSPGVFANPEGVLNAASYSPFTAGISSGELIRIFGAGLSPKTNSDARFPTTLEGVRVSINNRPAPIYKVSDNELVVQVPWGTTGSVVSIQVINGAASNVVTTFLQKVTTCHLFYFQQT